MTNLAKIWRTALLCLALAAHTRAADTQAPIRTVFADSIPATRGNQILLHTHLYLACLDPDARQPVWIAYEVSRADWDTGNVLSRNFHTPKPLRQICLEQSDYAESGYEMGHLYGLQFVSASRFGSEVNNLAVIGAQRKSLNRGPWYDVEQKIRRLSEHKPVKVIAGLLWIGEMPGLPQADEPHRVASHWWIIIKTDDLEEGYLFPQTAEQTVPAEQFLFEASQLRQKISADWWKEMP